VFASSFLRRQPTGRRRGLPFSLLFSFPFPSFSPAPATPGARKKVAFNFSPFPPPSPPPSFFGSLPSQNPPEPKRALDKEPSCRPPPSPLFLFPPPFYPPSCSSTTRRRRRRGAPCSSPPSPPFSFPFPLLFPLPFFPSRDSFKRKSRNGQHRLTPSRSPFFFLLVPPLPSRDQGLEDGEESRPVKVRPPPFSPLPPSFFLLFPPPFFFSVRRKIEGDRWGAFSFFSFFFSTLPLSFPPFLISG